MRVRAVGVCGTDLHILAGRLPGTAPPLILGHEIAGLIDAVGPGSCQAREGDRVTVDQVVGCGECFYCARGSRQFCERGFELGITRDGGCQDYLILPASNVHPLPETISFEEAAILDMEVWAAIHKAGSIHGATVLITGNGPVGLIACQIARAMGAVRILLTGLNRERMAIAESLQVADRYVLALNGEVGRVVAGETGGRGVDVAIECAGSPAAVSDAIGATVRGGRVILFGVHPDAAPAFDINSIVLKDLTIFGALSDRIGWEEVISLVTSGRLQLAPLITHRFPLHRAPEAYDLVRRSGDSVMKAVLLL